MRGQALAVSAGALLGIVVGPIVYILGVELRDGKATLERKHTYVDRRPTLRA
jgi:hypothetical protein